MMIFDETASALARLHADLCYLRSGICFWRLIGPGLCDDEQQAQRFFARLRHVLKRIDGMENAISLLANEQARWDARVCLKLLRYHLADATTGLAPGEAWFNEGKIMKGLHDLKKTVRSADRAFARGLLRAAIAAEISLEDRLAQIGATVPDAFRIGMTDDLAGQFIHENPGSSHKEVCAAVGVEESTFRSHTWPRLKARGFRPGINGRRCYPPNS